MHPAEALARRTSNYQTRTSDCRTLSVANRSNNYYCLYESIVGLLLEERSPIVDGFTATAGSVYGLGSLVASQSDFDLRRFA